MARNPTNMQRGVADLVSSAVANTQTTGILVAAAPAGFAYRVWSFHAAPTNTAQAVVNWRAQCYTPGDSIAVLTQTGNSFAAPPMEHIAGGWKFPVISDIHWAIQSALASLAIRLTVYYTIEAV